MPLDGVVREGDGTMTVWVTTDGHHFTQRTVSSACRTAATTRLSTA
jgi:hypothetical protein